MNRRWLIPSRPRRLASAAALEAALGPRPRQGGLPRRYPYFAPFATQVCIAGTGDALRSFRFSRETSCQTLLRRDRKPRYTA